jgi:hypothetical protein
MSGAITEYRQGDSWTARTRFTVHVAGATADGKQFEYGYSSYVVTWASWNKKRARINREHGGNMVTRWFWRGKPILPNGNAEQFVSIIQG